ncbi:DUF2975 domain-containing protein [Microbacterium ulmi]|uniref:DUF2975 domain-containing protein n=1 Tax=Microbacterium ulmi TaxID=179095 RepID=A0A7Y2LYQ1_9MICO|nr:DUF2975 domain-containing protein [Microbacterium ulmi]NII69774.1 xanthosine utilization system XapX-like protein [Microbacterium ulmi]NNH03254.1 DUF2975 domain-containing protein [Microbacterium ulmi]
MHRITIAVLKGLIVVLVGLLLFCQIVVLPVTASGLARLYPEFADLEVPGIIIGVVFAVCAQIVLVCVWRLLSLVRIDGTFDEKAFAWVDVALGAVVLATLLIVGSLLLLQAAGASPPSIALLCLIGIVVGAGLSLLIVVLRGLLKKASQLEHDLSEVV